MRHPAPRSRLFRMRRERGRVHRNIFAAEGVGKRDITAERGRSKPFALPEFAALGSEGDAEALR